MSTIVWPYGNQFRASRVDWGRKFNQRVSTSSLNGSVQTSDLPGTRWTLLMQFPAQTKADRRALMALIASLEGRRNRAQIWDFGCYVPQGNWTPSGVTVGSAASQFAGSLTLAGCVGRNRLRLPERYDQTSAWLTQSSTVTSNATISPDGATTADKIEETAVSSSHGVANITGGNALAGETWTVSHHIKAAERSYAYVWLDRGDGYGATVQFNLSTLAASIRRTNPTVWSSPTPFIVPAANGFFRCGLSAKAEVNSFCQTRVYMGDGSATNDGYGNASYLGVAGSGLYVWGGQVEKGPLTEYAPYAQATAGDWLQVPTSTGNQLLQITADATANDAGQMTVPITPMLRGSVASGAAVTLSKPSALFILADPDNIMWPQEAGGICPPVTIEFMEVFS